MQFERMFIYKNNGLTALPREGVVIGGKTMAVKNIPLSALKNGRIKRITVNIIEDNEKPEKPKGQFQCYYNGHEFDSNDLGEYHQHMFDSPHVMNGGFQCQHCKANLDVKNEPIVNERIWKMCKSCHKRVYIDFPNIYPTFKSLEYIYTSPMWRLIEQRRKNADEILKKVKPESKSKMRKRKSISKSKGIKKSKSKR